MHIERVKGVQTRSKSIGLPINGPGQADQTGSASGCLKTWGLADRSLSRQPERRRPIRRSGRDPGLRRYARTSPNHGSRAGSTIHILPADSARLAGSSFRWMAEYRSAVSVRPGFVE